MFSAIKRAARNVLSNHGYYKVDDMTDSGYCEFCGVKVNGIFPKWNNAGICNECDSGNVIMCDTCEYWQMGIPCGHCKHPDVSYLPTNDIDVFVHSNPKLCPRAINRQIAQQSI